MAISANTALRRICELKDWSITNLQANKLLYFAHMIALGEVGDPLVTSRFEAWDLGPVLPDAYHTAKMFGNKPIKPFIFRGRGEIPEWEVIFDRTLNEVGNLSGAGLVAESHWEQGAWAKHYRTGAKGIEIPNGDILVEYQLRTAD
ncbi:Panacea domain-containing protein [Parasphingorhabdus sp.]|uniref:Panacea domain-containing protein n=1 Tax=Parasphingorhabdus sp. TaxID=2709688 RepID=UPI003D2CE23B